MSEDKSTLKLLISGKQTPKFMGIYIGCILLFYLLVIILAQSVFPEGYSLMNYTISTQGGIEDNPHGWWIYDIGVIIIGIVFIPFFTYIYQRLKPTTLLLSKFAYFFALVGSIGFALLGVFPHDFGFSHGIATGLAFGGFGASAFFTFFVLVRKLFLKESWPTITGFIIVFGQLIVVVLLTTIIQNSEPLESVEAIDPRIYNYPFSQWSMMISLAIWIIGIYIISRKAEVKES
jgi:Protein of unknown function (DUF998)